MLIIPLAIFASSFMFDPHLPESRTEIQDTVYSQADVDVKAEYSGGEKERVDFLERKIDLFAATDGAPNGTYKVIITCIIDTQGKIIAMKPETDFGYDMEKEVMKVIKKLPKPYRPAMKDGKPVMSKIAFPMTFTVGVRGS